MLTRCFAFVLAALPALAFSVSLAPSIEGQARVAEMVNWSARAEGSESDSTWYRFRVRRSGERFRLVRDFGPSASLDWTASDREGVYEIEVTARNNVTGETVSASVVYRFASRVDGSSPVVSATGHPLVALYSAPPCPNGATMRVQFRSSEGRIQETPRKNCNASESMNFYVAGMTSATAYRVRHIISSGTTTQEGPEMVWTTGETSTTFEGVSTTPDTASRDGMLLFCTLSNAHVATDLAGRLTWYYPGYLSKLTRPSPGGLFVGLVEEPVDHAEQILREFDLVGMTVRETNVARVNEQLSALGKRNISTFHHEARTLPDGHMLVLASVEESLNDTTTGAGWVNMIGDMIIVLDRDLAPVWVWDAFDFLDAQRPAILNETCANAQPGCPLLYRDSFGNDWLHGNSVALAPDGNLVYSARHQDWVYKIDYNRGHGSGVVLWRLGRDGDFQAVSSDPDPWFTHQHDAEYDAASGLLIVFDNGNTRRLINPQANSRGQAIHLDEDARTATFVLNADLGDYSAALGSARRLPDGNFQFDLGIFPDFSSRVVEVNPAGELVYDFRSPIPLYRVFRMGNLYTPF